MTHKVLFQRLGVGLGTYAFRILVSVLKILGLDPLLILLFDFRIAVIGIFVVSLIISFFLIWLYDQFKQDWFSIEYIKEIRSGGGQHDTLIQSRFIRRIVTMSKIEEYVLITVFLFIDPILVVLFTRKGHHKYDGFKSKKVVFLFVGSTFLSSIVLGYILQSLIVLLLEFIS